jgi:hypothetical protein
MSLPDYTLDANRTAGNWLSPYDRYTDALTDFEAGGIALNDGTQGLDYQIWSLRYEGDRGHPDYGDFIVTGETTGETSVILNVDDVRSCALAFDQNMNPFIAYETDDCAAKFYWYDSFISAYTTTTLPAGSKYIQCCLDDHRQTQTGTSDIIIAYLRGGNLYTREQRDRYSVEYDHGARSGVLRKIGMTDNLRLYADIRGGTTALLIDIVGDLCTMSGLRATDMDLSSLDGTVLRGWLTAGTYSAADAIRSLQKTFFFDLPEYDGKIRAVLRGGAVVATIAHDDMVVGEEIDVETAREQGVEFPRVLHLAYASAESDYTPTKETSERRSPNLRVTSKLSIETSVNYLADDAAQVADVLHKIAWNEMEGRAEFGVSEAYSYLVPSDPISVETYPGTYKRMRIQRIAFVDGVLQIEAVMDRVSAYSSAATGNTPPTPTPPPGTLPGDTTWEFMDLPALLTDHDTLHYYVAGYGAAAAWRGAQLQREVGTEFQKEADIPYAEMMGQVEEALPLAPAEFIDTTNTLLLSLNDTPESTTTELMLAGKGAWLVGDEIIQVRDWVAEGDDWRGSYLFRGRLDTTPALHSIGARAVFLGNPITVPVDVSLRDTTLDLRAPSYGQVATDATETSHSFIGRSQEEWPPEDLTANQSGNDWVLSWVPRYRLGNSANPIPSAHFFDWRIRFTVGGTTVSYDVGSTDPAYTYLEADQITDFGSAQSSFDDVEIRALNYLGGEGKALSEAVS